MTHHDPSTGPTQDTLDAWDKEARARWGHTDAYAQSAARWKSYTKEEKDRMRTEMDAGMKKLAELMPQGVGDAEVQALIGDGLRFINEWFYDCDVDMYEQLALLKTHDDRYAESYRAYHPDLPDFHTEAVLHYCARMRKEK